MATVNMVKYGQIRLHMVAVNMVKYGQIWLQ
jgi:hypothetical protein